MVSTAAARAPRAAREIAPKKRRISRDDRLDLLFHALSDRTRRSILARLSRLDSDSDSDSAPLSITELAEPFAMSLPAVSKHIRVLERAGLVKRTVDGRVHRCSLQASSLREVDRWLAHYRAFWDEALQ